LIWEEEGKVKLAYNDPLNLARRHGVENAAVLTHSRKGAQEFCGRGNDAIVHGRAAASPEGSHRASSNPATPVIRRARNSLNYFGGLAMGAIDVWAQITTERI
jgi:hypothetical protein